MECIGRGPNQFCEVSAKVPNWVTGPFRSPCLDGSVYLSKKFGWREVNLTSPLIMIVE